MSSTYRSVSALSEIAFKNGRKVKDMDVVRDVNNGVVRQFVRNNLTNARPTGEGWSLANPGALTKKSKRVHFNLALPSQSQSRNKKQSGVTFRRMPTPYFTRKSKGLRKFGKNRK